MPLASIDDETEVAAERIVRRLGPVGTRDLVKLLECAPGQRDHAMAMARHGDEHWATVAEIASRLYRDEPMLRKLVHALRQQAEV